SKRDWSSDVCSSDWHSPTTDDASFPELPPPDPAIGRRLIESHHAAREVVRERSGAKVGWTVANRALVARPGAEARLQELRHIWEDLYLEAASGGIGRAHG